MKRPPISDPEDLPESARPRRRFSGVSSASASLALRNDCDSACASMQEQEYVCFSMINRRKILRVPWEKIAESRMAASMIINLSEESLKGSPFIPGGQSQIKLA
jgi:hypothetical protein